MSKVPKAKYISVYQKRIPHQHCLMMWKNHFDCKSCCICGEIT